MTKEPEGYKYLTKEQLIEALKEVPSDYWLYVNRVGNLGVRTSQGEYAGFVDFLFNGNYEV